MLEGTLKRNSKSVSIDKLFLENSIFVDFAIISSLLEEKTKVNVPVLELQCRTSPATPGFVRQCDDIDFKLLFRFWPQ